MRILAPYLPDAPVAESDELCFTIVKVSKNNWQVVDASDGYLICSCPSKFLARFVAEAVELNFERHEV